MREHDQHVSPIKTPRQLVVVVVLAFAIPITLIALLTQLVTGVSRPPSEVKENERLVLERIQPYGSLVLAAATGPKGSLSGADVFTQVCKTCHEAGLAGAPKVGDKAAWAPRIKEGAETLFKHAIAGYQGKSGVMPAKGGNPDLTDTEVQRAVVYMANASGASFKEPAPAPDTKSASASPIAQAAAATPPPAAAAAPAAAPAPAAQPAAAATVAKPDGKKTFESTCMVCHGAGIAGAPKFGDKAAWAPRLAQGVNVLYDHALNGFNGKSGAMPPKGGNKDLPDADVKAAVDYMAAAAK
jgi:cytochrome c5